MVEQITFQTIFQFLQTVSIMVGVAYHILVLQNQQKNQKLSLETRKASLFMQLYNTNLNEDLNREWADHMRVSFTDYDEFDKSIGPNSEDGMVKLHTIWQKYNGIGHLLMQGLLDQETAYYHAEGWRAVLLWMKWKPFIIEMRERYFNPDYMDGFQHIGEEMIKYREEKDLPNKIPERFLLVR